MWLSGANLKYLRFLRGLFGKVLATSHERLRVLMASLFRFGSNMLRFEHQFSVIFGICFCARTPGLCHGKDRISIPYPRLTYPKITPFAARVFERAVEENLSTTQFAYRESGNCTSVPLAIQLKLLPLNAYIINWYHSFLYNRQQRIVHNNYLHKWRGVNKGTTQGSVGGSYLFNVFLDDLDIKLGSTPALFKYADDSTIIASVWKGGSDTSSGLVEKFLTWANCNSMSCNPNKCKELVIKKKWNSTFYTVVCNIPQHATLKLLGLTFQNNCNFFAHIKAKLC